MANHDHHEHGKHHVLTDKLVFKIGGLLALLTIITVAVAQVDLGSFNFLVAILVASVKGSLVALFFMNLYYDTKENGLIFSTSFVFLAIFFILTGVDIFFRPEGIYTDGKPVQVAQAASKLKNPWISTPDLVKQGQALYTVNCVSCHGPNGQGDGVAAAALNPKPRNFHSTAGWKNGRKVSMVFKTLKEGLPGTGMASFGTLPSDDRWALTHFVVSLGGAVDKDTPEDFAKAGVDVAGGGGEKVEKSIPVEFAIDRMALPETN